MSGITEAEVAAVEEALTTGYVKMASWTEMARMAIEAYLAVVGAEGREIGPDRARRMLQSAGYLKDE